MGSVKEAVRTYRSVLARTAEDPTEFATDELADAMCDVVEAACGEHPETSSGAVAQLDRAPAAAPVRREPIRDSREVAGSSPARPAPSSPTRPSLARPKPFPQPGALTDLVLQVLRAGKPERWWQTGELREAVAQRPGAVPDIAKGAKINVALAALETHHLVERKPHEHQSSAYRWHVLPPKSS